MSEKILIAIEHGFHFATLSTELLPCYDKEHTTFGLNCDGFSNLLFVVFMDSMVCILTKYNKYLAKDKSMPLYQRSLGYIMPLH